MSNTAPPYQLPYALNVPHHHHHEKREIKWLFMGGVTLTVVAAALIVILMVKKSSQIIVQTNGSTDTITINNTDMSGSNTVPAYRRVTNGSGNTPQALNNDLQKREQYDLKAYVRKNLQKQPLGAVAGDMAQMDDGPTSGGIMNNPKAQEKKWNPSKVILSFDL